MGQTSAMKNTKLGTGLKIEKHLYLLAQKHAANFNQSFAAYVVDLIAADLIDHPAGAGIPDIERMRHQKARSTPNAIGQTKQTVLESQRPSVTIVHKSATGGQ